MIGLRLTITEERCPCGLRRGVPQASSLGPTRFVTLESLTSRRLVGTIHTIFLAEARTEMVSVVQGFCNRYHVQIRLLYTCQTVDRRSILSAQRNLDHGKATIQKCFTCSPVFLNYFYSVLWEHVICWTIASGTRSPVIYRKGGQLEHTITKNNLHYQSSLAVYQSSDCPERLHVIILLTCLSRFCVHIEC